MRKPVICHDQDTAFLDALRSCLATGLTVELDGVPQTQASLERSFRRRDPDSWTGTVLLNDKGDVRGLSFTANAICTDQNPSAQHL